MGSRLVKLLGAEPADGTDGVMRNRKVKTKGGGNTGKRRALESLKVWRRLKDDNDPPRSQTASEHHRVGVWPSNGHGVTCGRVG